MLMKHTFESEKSSHPGFVISFDNLDIQLQRKNMSMESQNRDYHWVNHQMLENRVWGSSQIERTKCKPGGSFKPQFLPTLDAQQQQRSNYIILTAWILVNYFDALAPLKYA